MAARSEADKRLLRFAIKVAKAIFGVAAARGCLPQIKNITEKQSGAFRLQSHIHFTWPHLELSGLESHSTRSLMGHGVGAAAQVAVTV